MATEIGSLWGSDALAAMLRRLDVGYVALNPGSSFRGLHDSLVNYLGNADPKMLLCLHEENAVALAHGWAKVTGKPMAVVLHANVGLMHATMAIYNAWCDRVPMVILGAGGPVDADLRRPWIDWIHTSRDQAAIVRPYVKWDDQPASLNASLRSMAQASVVTRTAPQAPTYVCFDVTVQETRLDDLPELPDPAAFAVPDAPIPAPGQIDDFRARLESAKNPVFLMGRMSRSDTDWAARVALAERFDAKVLTDIKTGAVFPTDHPLHVGPPSFFLSGPQAEALRNADLIVAFDWVDVAGAIKQAGAGAPVVNVSIDHHLANGWSFDHTGPVGSVLHIAAMPDACVAALATSLGLQPGPVPESLPALAAVPFEASSGPISMRGFAAALGEGLGDELVTLVRLPLGWDASTWHFRHPLDYLGYDGGAGIGSGPGMLVGAALALQDSGRLPVAVLGDGDTMMGISALWTAARYEIPMLAVVCNNRSYFNDEVHQEKVAKARNRPVENKWVGQAITGPDLDFAAMAKAQGLVGIGPVSTPDALAEAVAEGLRLVKEGAAVLIDARVEPAYSEAMAKGMTTDG
ncbi:thiamine pyrophosphate-binding protein [Rhodobium gokarnense]|uniref:Thiamine pyrophosphate-dependent acetolactate synthase large subunit-like protein n=1 Tax=Rhodobium gokarnense TaxID=364296 RepID=A0ABT3HB31_9HYPH|nr:thiamine pyrophosphate-binding protein [Rhodobium gokarnense]MCW2307544.1 thiamine pyrophosphate-dependent acetolactate synthase large subunit-like protein [Rhodobium gokarnense]